MADAGHTVIGVGKHHLVTVFFSHFDGHFGISLGISQLSFIKQDVGQFHIGDCYILEIVLLAHLNRLTDIDGGTIEFAF